MIKNGVQLTCRGCGIDTFIEVSPIARDIFSPYNDQSVVTHYNEEQSESWVKTRDVMDLCPRCAKIREEMLCKFYEECGAARDKEAAENG